MKDKSISIGRNPACTIQIDERWDTVSNNHADIELFGNQLIFHDHSSNGTYIDGQKIHNQDAVIFPENVIKLAGAYTLDWQTIKYYFPEFFATQPKRTLNQNNDLGHKTVKIGGEQQAQQGRATEQFQGQPSGDFSHGSQEEQERKQRFGVENKYSQADIDNAMEKWNWGAFFCTWLWALPHKIYWPLAVLLLVAIPYIGVVASLFLCVYLGMNGSRMAWNSGIYDDFEAYLKAQKKWTIIGIIWFIISIAVNAACIYYVLSI